MSRTGRPCTPNALKIAAGNPGKRPISDDEPMPTGKPTCPRWLGREAKDEWRRVMRAMPGGMITTVDRASLAAYCQAWAEFAEAAKLFESVEDHCYTTANGNRLLRPESLVMQRAHERMTKLAGQFGFTPSARANMHVAKPADTGDALDKLIRKSRSG